MRDFFSGQKLNGEGYVYNTYGEEKYLRHAVASVVTLRRYDLKRPIAIFCSEHHADLLKGEKLNHLFTKVYILPEENRSITGFKHNIDRFMPFEKNLYLDSDIIWCKDPDLLWQSFSPYRYTITGNQTSDNFFGGPKGLGILKDVLFRKRNRTLKKFGLTYLSRVQSGMIYAADYQLTTQVCEWAKKMLKDKHLTHFRSRMEESGRSEESCEWSLAMAMSKLELQVFPWFYGYISPQLDFIENFTTYDADFKSVSCLYYSNKTVYNLRGFPVNWIQKLLLKFLTIFPGKGDHLYVTPFCLHFGWYHQKQPFFDFADRIWEELHSDITDTKYKIV